MSKYAPRAFVKIYSKIVQVSATIWTESERGVFLPEQLQQQQLQQQQQ